MAIAAPFSPFRGNLAPFKALLVADYSFGGNNSGGSPFNSAKNS